MQKQSQISVTCGTIYSKLCPYDWYSSLDHSVGVALIILHFTQDKKQTLAGLFHDIATPAFKHTIDFLKGDYGDHRSFNDANHNGIQRNYEIAGKRWYKSRRSERLSSLSYCG